MGWLLPDAKPQRSALAALGSARRKGVPKFDEGLKSVLCNRWQQVCRGVGTRRYLGSRYSLQFTIPDLYAARRRWLGRVDCGPSPISSGTASISLRKLANVQRKALVDHSRAIPPRPACGERVGVRGVLVTAQRPPVGQKAAPHPVAARRAATDLSPQAGRGDWAAWYFFTGSQPAAITYADLGNEVLERAESGHEVSSTAIGDYELTHFRTSAVSNPR
jgi:hypothetical protein